MAKILSIFTLRHLFFLSLALNVSLIMRLAYEGGNQGHNGFSTENQREEPLMTNGGAATEIQADKMAHLSVPSSSSTTSAPVEVEDDEERIIDFNQGDPTMYEKFWHQMGDKTTIVIPGWQSMSYFSDGGNLCWFLEPEFARQVRKLHAVVGNAVTDGRHIVVGTGSTQLFQAVLYALSSPDATEPISVVSAAPYYSFYASVTDCLKSGLYKWAGDARSFNKEGPYIEMVTSPNNPDGFVRSSVVNQSGGILVHDLAYYWPQYTPISSPADYDIMLFTVSKSTGHAGLRIGWALVKDQEVAKRMTKYIELNTIGVSKDSQLRAAKVLKVVAENCEHPTDTSASLFEFGFHHMARRWKQLRDVAQQGDIFSLPEFTPSFCSFLGRIFEPQPAFAWLKCEKDIEDCESFLRGKKILTRGGKHFGVSPKYVRISMLDRDKNFETFLTRMSAIQT